MILWWSHDDGALYKPEDTDGDLENYDRFVVPDTFSLTAEQVTRGYGSILEILLRAGVAKKLNDDGSVSE